MKAHLLVLHRKEHHPGEHAPEILAVCDEWTLDDNADWWETEKRKQRDLIGNDASAWAEVTIDLDDDALMAALYPANKVEATITDTTPLPGLADPATSPAHDPRIGVGSWVMDANADPDDITIDDLGYVNSIQDGGYGVIWQLGTPPRYAGADEVAYIDQDLAETTVTGA